MRAGMHEMHTLRSLDKTKNAPRRNLLETSNNNTRGTTQIAAFRRHFGLRQVLSLNAGRRVRLAWARRTGSEVMGLMAPDCRLAPTVGSLKVQTAGPSSSQPFVIFALMTTL